MNILTKLSAGLMLLTLMAFTLNPIKNQDCSILQKGEFTYGSSDNLTKVVIKGKNHTEYHDNGKYIIKSKMEWVNECEYNMTMKKITIPNFPYKKGDVMNVKIDRVENNKIYYTSTVKGQSWKSILTKIK